MNRTIEFWQIVNEDGSSLLTNFPAQKLISDMLAARDAGYDLAVTTPDDVQLQLEPYNYRRDAPFLALYKPRPENQSQMIDHGEIRNLPFTEDQYIAEVTYFHFFERNVIGFLYYNESPRPKRLIDYINTKFGGRLDLVPIYSRDLDRMLREMSVQNLELRIPSSQAAVLTREVAGSFAAPLTAASNLIHDGGLSLVLSVGRRGDRRARTQRKESIVELAREAIRFRHIFASAKVYGKVGDKNDFPVDLLAERFAHKVSVPPAPFIPNAEQIRDETGIIRDQYAMDREFLDSMTTPIANLRDDDGLLGTFRNEPIGE